MDAHQAKAGFPGLFCGLFYLGNGEGVLINHCIKESGADTCGCLQPLLIELAVFHKFREINRSQHAAFKVQKRLFTTGIGGVDGPEVGGGVVAVDFVKEEHAGLSVLPDSVNNRVPDLTDRDLLTGIRVGDPDLLHLTFFDTFHECVVHHHRDVEIFDFPLFGL